MTYTFKLARRLAVSRRFGMLPGILLFVACSGGDATAPGSDSLGPQEDWRSRKAVTVSVNPSRVTVETNQLIRFLARGRNSAGDSVYAPITWRATGGTILPDGRFSSDSAGTFMVTGRARVTGPTREREAVRLGTSTVVVVRSHPNLQTIEIAPGNATLAPGVTQSFVATGRLKAGRSVPVGVVWHATGGTIDAGGNYVAGDTAGTYRVTATHTTVTIADTAIVTITAPPPPPPPPATSPPADTTTPPTPTLAQVTLLPASATLAPSTTRQYTAYGQTTGGDSVAVSVVFAATGGTVTAGGLYTAGSTAGTFRVIATSGALADTSTVSVTVPLGSGTPVGIPFGAYRLLNAGVATAPLTLSADFNSPSSIVTQIGAARQKGVRIMLVMTGGAHRATNPGCCLSIINGVLQFDRAKWDATLATFNTAAIRDAIAKGVADGTIVGATVMDEPYVHGGGDGNTWGPTGTMTKARVDSLCTAVQRIFPTLPAGVEHQHHLFEPTKSYQVCQFIVDQYGSQYGSVTAWRDAGLAMGARDHHAILFSLNVLNGGVQDKDGTRDCAGTGGLGLYSPNCRMTADQVRTYGLTLGPAGCGLFMWRYDDAFMSNSENQRAFRDIAAQMATAPGRSCRRS